MHLNFKFQAHTVDEVDRIETVERSNSETDLKRWLEKQSNTLDRDSDSSSQKFNDHHDILEKIEQVPEKLEKEEDKQQDCDLFFDFDISSPTQNKSLDHDFDEKFRPEAIAISDFRRSSESSVENLTGYSTAFGSTSSGLFSDQENSSNSDLKSADDQGFCIAPEDWQKLNFVDLLALGKTDTPQATSSPIHQNSSKEVTTPQAPSPQGMIFLEMIAYKIIFP